MKILYFYQYFCTPKGSYGTRAYEFAKRWVENGHDVTVVTSVYDKSDLKPEKILDTLIIEGIKIKVINIRLSNKHGKFIRLLTFFAYMLYACWHALTQPADIVLASSGPPTVGLPGIIAKIFRRKPFIFEVRDLFSEGLEELGVIQNKRLIKIIKRFEALFYKSSDVVVALSETMKEWIIKGYPTNRVVVIPNACDNKFFVKTENDTVPEPLKSGKASFVFTGTIGKANNCIQLVKVGKKLKENNYNNINIFLIGDGKEKKGLEEKAKEYQLENVHFIPLMPREQLVEWLTNSTCALLILAKIDVFNTVSPNKFFDSLSAGKPIIQTTQGWIKDVIEKHRCGLTVDPQDPDSLYHHILTIANDKKLAEEMGKRAKVLAETEYDRDKLSNDYLRLFEELNAI